MKVVILKMISCEKIREAIKQSCFSFQDISLLLGIHRATLFDKIKTERLSVKEINEIARVLNLKYEDIKGDR